MPIVLRAELCGQILSRFGTFGKTILSFHSSFFGYRNNGFSCLLISKYHRKKFPVEKTSDKNFGINSKKPFVKETERLKFTYLIKMSNSERGHASDFNQQKFYGYPAEYQSQGYDDRGYPAEYQSQGYDDRGYQSQGHGGKGNQTRGQGGRGNQTRGQGGRGNQTRGQGGRGYQLHDPNHAQRGSGGYPRNKQGNQGGGWSQGSYNSYGNGSYQDRLREEDPLKFLSKSLSYTLRHGAEKQRLHIGKGGFILVREILSHQKFKGFTMHDVIQVVESNDKQRFALGYDAQGNAMIRANQGHTLEVEGLELKPITLENAEEFPVVIHGTYMKSWDFIKKTGLSRMSRNHIHFAPGEPQSDGVISGMRKTCDVLILLDLKAALKDGLQFFLSANNVILSPGDKDGFIKPCFFDAALTRSPRQRLQFDKSPGQVITADEVSGETEQKRKAKKKKKNKKSHDEEKPQGDGKKSRQDSSSEKQENKPEKKQEAEPEKKQEAESEKKQEAESEKSVAVDSENIVDENVTSDDSAAAIKPDPIVAVIDNLENCKDIVEVWKSYKDDWLFSVSCFTGIPSEEGSKYVIICISDIYDNVTVFDTKDGELMNSSSPLFWFLQDSKPTKVFYSCPLIGKVFFDSYQLAMSHMTVFDIQVTFSLYLKTVDGSKRTTESPSLEEICRELKVDMSCDQSCDFMETSIDWSVRPITEQMKDILMKTALLQMKAAQKLEKFSSDNRKELKKMTYELIKEPLDMEKVKKVIEDRKKKQKEEQQSTSDKDKITHGKNKGANGNKKGGNKRK